MKIEEDCEIPILLKRYFLVSVGVVIDVKCGRHTFEVRYENIEFLLSKLIKNPIFKDSWCKFDIIDQNVKECSFEQPFPGGFEACIIVNTNQ